MTSTQKIVGAFVLGAIAICFLLMISDYRVLIGEEKAPPWHPDMSGPPEPLQMGNVQIDARLLPPFGLDSVRCRYFTGRGVTTVTFDAESKIDSCPFLYKPKAYDRL